MARARDAKGRLLPKSAESTAKVKDRPRADVNIDDPTSVTGKDPSKEYRWASRRDENKLGRHEAHGYRVVNAKDAEAKGLKAPFLHNSQADGTIGNRDVVLMEADKATVQERRERSTKVNQSRVKRELESVAEQGLRDGLLTKREAQALVEEGFVQRSADE